MDIWQQVDQFICDHTDLRVSFNLQYTDDSGWVADFTPRRNHPRARPWALWQGQAETRDGAIRLALAYADAGVEAGLAVVA